MGVKHVDAVFPLHLCQAARLWLMCERHARWKNPHTVRCKSARGSQNQDSVPELNILADVGHSKSECFHGSLDLLRSLARGQEVLLVSGILAYQSLGFCAESTGVRDPIQGRDHSLTVASCWIEWADE